MNEHDIRELPVLAREVRSLQNGGLAKDGTVVTWKLKRGVQWHDGKPFTAQDVVFNWAWFGVYKNVKQMEALDSHTVKCVFTQPTPYWLTTGLLIPRHIFEPYKGARAVSSSRSEAGSPTCS